MHTLYALSRICTSARARGAFKVVMSEVSTLLDALLSPNKVVAEVEAMRHLQVKSDRVVKTA